MISNLQMTWQLYRLHRKMGRSFCWALETAIKQVYS